MTETLDTTDPIGLFNAWLEDAKNCKDIKEATAMTLATCGNDAIPSARIVLLKGASENGFIFYTNLESDKSHDVKDNPHAALCFYWMPLDRQVRIVGRIEQVSDDEADAYFASRTREKQIGAWSSRQSKPMPSRDTFEQAIAENTKRFEGKDVPRPPHWGGWRLIPETMEFWIQGDHRLHQRRRFTCHQGAWNQGEWLYP